MTICHLMYGTLAKIYMLLYTRTVLLAQRNNHPGSWNIGGKWCLGSDFKSSRLCIKISDLSRSFNQWLRILTIFGGENWNFQYTLHFIWNKTNSGGFNVFWLIEISKANSVVESVVYTYASIMEQRFERMLYETTAV